MPHSGSRFASLGLLLVPVLGTACSGSGYRPGNNDGSVPDDSRVDGAVPPSDPIWGCLGRVEEPGAVPGETHMYSIRLVDALTGEPPADVTARLCALVDADCDAPIIEDVAIGFDGLMTAPVTSGFEGYFELSASDMMPTILPIGPAVADSPADQEIGLARTVVLEAMAASMGLTLDPAEGHVVTTFVACDGEPRAGISFAHEPNTGDPYFLVAFSPDLEATASDESGNGGVLNADPGFMTLTSTRDATGDFIGRTRTPLRAGALTYVTLGPTTAP